MFSNGIKGRKLPIFARLPVPIYRWESISIRSCSGTSERSLEDAEKEIKEEARKIRVYPCIRGPNTVVLIQVFPRYPRRENGVLISPLQTRSEVAIFLAGTRTTLDFQQAWLTIFKPQMKTSD